MTHLLNCKAVKCSHQTLTKPLLPTPYMYGNTDHREFDYQDISLLIDLYKSKISFKCCGARFFKLPVSTLRIASPGGDCHMGYMTYARQRFPSKTKCCHRVQIFKLFQFASCETFTQYFHIFLLKTIRKANAENFTFLNVNTTKLSYLPV